MKACAASCSSSPCLQSYMSAWKTWTLPLGQKLAAMAEFLVGDVAVVAMPGELEALPEVHHVDQVFERVLRADQAER